MDDNSNNSRVLTEEEYLETCQALNEAAESEEKAADKTVKSASNIKPGKTIRFKPNISAAVTNIKQYLSGKGPETGIIVRIKRYLIPIRPGRSYGRNIKSQSATTLLYRVA